MYRKILVGYDGRDQGDDALALAKQLADATGAELVVAGVVQYDPIWGGFDPAFRDADAEFSDKIRKAAKSIGAEAESVPASSPARGLHERAAEIGADLIVVGSAKHGRLGQLLAGNVGLALLHGAPCAVAIAPHGFRDREAEGITAVEVGFDGSEQAGLALRAGIELARQAGATLKLVSVAEPPPVVIGSKDGASQGRQEFKEGIEDLRREEVRDARELVPEGIDVKAIVVDGDPAESLAEVAKTPGTILVVGSRGYGPLRAVLLGSVSRELIRQAPCPLIVQPRAKRDASGRRSTKAEAKALG
ncbi:MAG TPA: universal stress protein [Thermoleophilaceae bacterium]|jgi:nucleotide-binding universal stress UspA family protein|nr:universal stress protein [Thermoleophilaceae bacterium]